MENELHNNVKAEILFNQTKQDTYTNIAYVTTVGIWTVAFSVGNKWVSLIPLLCLLPISIQIAYCRRSIAFLSAYIIACLNTSSNEYEKLLVEYHKKFGRIKFDLSKSGLLFLDFVSIVFFWSLNGWHFIIDNRKPIFSLVIILLQIIIVIIEIFNYIKYSDITRVKSKMIKNWEVIYRNKCSKKVNHKQ